jgi:microcystin-dependent protein
MAEPFLGQIMMFGGNFAPRGWQFCAGQLLSISQNAALFSLLGTTYGGNGTTTFALPDLRGRFPLGMGNGPGLSPVVEGQIGGTESVSILTSNMPSHSHSLNGSASAGTQSSPVGGAIAAINTGSVKTPATTALGFVNTAPTGPMQVQSIGQTGNNIPMATMPPYLGVNYIIALEGIFPSRN